MLNSNTLKPAPHAAWPFAKGHALEHYRPAVENMKALSGTLCDAYTAMGTEWLGFINRRLHTDLSLTSRLASCSGPQDYFQEWADFMKTAAEEYRHEFAVLTEMNSTVSRQALSSLQASAGSTPVSVWPGL